MTICELAQFNEMASASTNVAPFTYQSLPASHQTADYWKDTFGAADESITRTIFISSFVRGSNIFYASMISLLDCIDQEQSFHWSITSEILYVHYEHDQSRFTDSYEYGTVEGFTDKDSIYIDNLYYNSLIQSIPSIAQQQDIVNADKLSFISGTIELLNVQGVLDYLIERKIIGNDVRIYHLDDSDHLLNYTRSDLVALASFFLEDYDIGLSKASFHVQDIRKKQNIEIPTETFTIDDYPDINEKYLDDEIPLMYGQVRSSEAIPVDGDTGAGTVTLRQAVVLTVLGTVQVEIDNLWTTKVPDSEDLPNGLFVLSAANGRKANGTPYKCRVLNSTGIAVTYSSDIIKDLNNRYLNISYLNSTYDTDEWEVEETQLEAIGILFNKKIKLYDAIKLVQQGSNIGFRYEIAADGRRTIRIDDTDRALTCYVTNNDIFNINEMEIKTNRELLAAFIKVEYSRDYELKKNLYITDESQAENVLLNYREQPTITIETSLVTESQAEARGLLYANKFSTIPKLVDLKLFGIDYYTVRIYDIIEVELTAALVDADTGQIIEGRKFYGVWRLQILSIDPDFDNQVNNITAYLIEEIEPVTVVRITTGGYIRSIENSGTATIKRAVGV